MTRAVLVAVGEVCDRPERLEEGLDPIGLMEEATARAEVDLGGPIRSRIDSLDIVHLISWRYEDTARRVCERLGLEPAHAVYHPGGGESPLRLIHEAALRIERGESKIALICSAESMNTSKKARREGITLPWPRRAKEVEHSWNVDTMLGALPRAHGIAQPTYVYPFYENASASAWGITPAEAYRESAALWAQYSKAAAKNEYAWTGAEFTAEQIAQVGEKNPLIAYPYPRYMVANPTVNQGAALIVMSDEEADDIGIAPQRRVALLGGAAANEPSDYLHRSNYVEAPAQKVVLDAALSLVPDDHFDALELYSCFPCVPKMARRHLGLPEGFNPTVTGGLTFFGGPFSCYMLHSACAMVRSLRGSGRTGLLYGQGDFVTKHHALVLSGEAPKGSLEQEYRLDSKANQLRGALPPIVEQATGDATLESFTVLPDRDGGLGRAVAILALPGGERTMARVPGDDRQTLGTLVSQERSPIGFAGALRTADDGLLEWSVNQSN